MHTLVVVVVMSEVDSRLRLETETPTSYMLHVSVSVSKSKLTCMYYYHVSCIIKCACMLFHTFYNVTMTIHALNDEEEMPLTSYRCQLPR